MIVDFIAVNKIKKGAKRFEQFFVVHKNGLLDFYSQDKFRREKGEDIFEN